jgi:hypothetical protein
MMVDDYDVHLYYFDLIIEILMKFHLMIDLKYQKFLVVVVVVVVVVVQDQKMHVDHGKHLMQHQEFFLHVIFEHH